MAGEAGSSRPRSSQPVFEPGCFFGREHFRLSPRQARSLRKVVLPPAHDNYRVVLKPDEVELEI
jgi:hypothetical protein